MSIYSYYNTNQHFAERHFLSYASSLSFYKESDMLYSNGHDYDFTLLYIPEYIFLCKKFALHVKKKECTETQHEKILAAGL